MTRQDSTMHKLGPSSWPEQEYYNVYLGGYVSGYPVTVSTDLARVAFASLIGDNINKVPRDLSEVGPDQKQFRSSVVNKI